MNREKRKESVTNFSGCQLTCVPEFAVAGAGISQRSLMISIKGVLRTQWNLSFKSRFKKIYYSLANKRGPTTAQKKAKTFTPSSPFVEGDIVKVRSREEIISTLDPFNQLKGCTFFHEMFQYCGTKQRVFRVMKNFIDERDYRYKKTRGIILLDNNFCSGKSSYGECDRCCFLFWREEWLEKIHL